MFNKKANLANSIYQQKGSGFGLTQKDGMLINNRPDGQTGIQQAVQIKKTIRRAEAMMMVSGMNDSSNCSCH